MKKIIVATILSSVVLSCSKIEETVTQTVSSAKEKAQQASSEIVQNTVNKQISKIVNAENVSFRSVFPHNDMLVLENEAGKKVAFPNGSPFYIFKYKTSEKDLLLNTLVEQPTTNEAKSEPDFEKVDGSSIIEKITFFERFLPSNTMDLSFLEDIKNDKSIEYYKIKRFPNASTLIYNPKNGMIYQFVEVKK